MACSEPIRNHWQAGHEEVQGRQLQEGFKWTLYVSVGVAEFKLQDFFRRPNFLHSKTLIFSDLGCKNWVFGRPNPKTDITFCRRLSLLVLYEYHFQVNFGQILKIVNCWLNFCRFPLIKPQNQKPVVLMVSMCPKNLKIGIWVPHTERQ